MNQRVVRSYRFKFDPRNFTHLPDVVEAVHDMLETAQTSNSAFSQYTIPL